MVFNQITYMNIKTIILARGGSKGIPQKNIIDINGNPLLSYTINAAKLSLANDIWVSTDCDKIAAVAKYHNVNIIKRPAHISGDKSKSDDALLHFADNFYFDILVFLQPTSPLILGSDINNGLGMMVSHDSIFSAYKEHWIPRWNIDGTPDHWDINNRPMRQDMPEKYVENGALYITTRQQLINSKLRYGGKIGILEMPIYRSFQIDTYEDLDIIKKIL
jgi:CMP-N-acetylneuraminic acid synthetase